VLSLCRKSLLFEIPLFDFVLSLRAGGDFVAEPPSYLVVRHAEVCCQSGVCAPCQAAIPRYFQAQPCPFYPSVVHKVIRSRSYHQSGIQAGEK